jgi:hypothetical protein
VTAKRQWADALSASADAAYRYIGTVMAIESITYHISVRVGTAFALSLVQANLPLI